MSKDNKIVVFQEKEVRRIWHNEEWWFSVLDVVEVLTETKDPSQYFKRMRQRDEELKNYVGTNCTHVALEGKTGKKRKTTIGNTEHLFRIIQALPSPKAEPFKTWLAKVGYERVQEIENPELAAKRSRDLYREKGYSDEWIDTRMKSINTRENLTNEWEQRGVKKNLEYAILTAEISQATFGLKPSEYKQLKNLKRENLRDHMTELELIFTMLGEAGTKKQAQEDDAQGFEENQKSAVTAGTATGDALNAYEKTSGQKVVTDENFIKQIEEAKKGIKGQKKLNLENPDDETTN